MFCNNIPPYFESHNLHETKICNLHIQSSFHSLAVSMVNTYHSDQLHDKCNNIPKKIFYSTIRAEIYRATFHYNFLLISARSLITRMRKQIADTEGIKRVITKMISRHSKPFDKYGIAAEQIALDISAAVWCWILFWCCKDSHFDCMVLKNKICNLASRHSTPTERGIRRW